MEKYPHQFIDVVEVMQNSTFQVNDVKEIPVFKDVQY